MRFSSLLPLAFGLALLATGCDRGAHPSQVGQAAPDIRMQDGTKVLSLDQFRGKIVVLNFWASWCPPCLEEFPSLAELQQEMPGIVVLAVSFDEDPSAYSQYLADNHIAVRTALDTSQRSNRAFGTTRPPETFILDRSGVVRRKFIGAQDWVSPEIVSYLKHL